MPLLKTKSKPEKRSPLKSQPAPLPGQSSEARLQALFEDKVLLWVMMAVLPVVFALMEWARWLFALPPQPIGISVLAVIAAAVAVRKLFALRREIARLRLGIDGEKWVGQFLETLRGRGYQVFHDIAEDGFNIDHALVGPGGVFSIETRTISKPVKGRPTIGYDGERVSIDGMQPDRDPVAQAKAAADHLRKILEQSTGIKRVPVRPVVLFPGWYIDKQPRGCAVWVLPPEALPGFLDHEDQVLSDEQAHMLGFHLTQYVKTRARNSP